MNDTDIDQHVKAMLAKAEAADKSEDAMKFAQAALNAANAKVFPAQSQRMISAAGRECPASISFGDAP